MKMPKWNEHKLVSLLFLLSVVLAVFAFLSTTKEILQNSYNTKINVEKCSTETYCPHFKAFLYCEVWGTDCRVTSEYGRSVKCSAKSIHGEIIEIKDYCL